MDRCGLLSNCSNLSKVLVTGGFKSAPGEAFELRLAKPLDNMSWHNFRL